MAQHQPAPNSLKTIVPFLHLKSNSTLSIVLATFLRNCTTFRKQFTQYRITGADLLLRIQCHSPSPDVWGKNAVS